MLRLFGDEVEPAIEAANGVLHTFSERYERYWSDGMRAKLGLTASRPGDGDLARDLLDLLQVHRLDMTSAFRALSAAAIDDHTTVHRAFPDPGAFDAWAARWRSRLAAEARPAGDVAAAMDRTNPVVHPAQPSRRRCPRRRHERRPGALRAAPRSRHAAIRNPSRSAGIHRAGTAGLRPLPDVLRHLRAVPLGRGVAVSACCRAVRSDGGERNPVPWAEPSGGGPDGRQAGSSVGDGCQFGHRFGDQLAARPPRVGDMGHGAVEGQGEDPHRCRQGGQRGRPGRARRARRLRRQVGRPALE